MSEPPVLKKPKIEKDDGSNGTEANAMADEYDREEQEEALVALIEHRTKEVEHIGNRISHYETQLDQAKKRLRDSETKLARLRNPDSVTSSKALRGDVIKDVKVERKSPSPTQNSEDISQNQLQFKPQVTQDNVKLIKKSPSNGHKLEQRSTNTLPRPPLVIPAVNPKISQPIKTTESEPKASSGSGSRPSSSSVKPKADTSHRAVPEKDADETQAKGTKRKFEQKEHKELIRMIGSSSTPRTIPCQTGSLISSQHKRKLRSLILCPTNDQLFVTSALDGIVNLWQVQARGCWSDAVAGQSTVGGGYARANITDEAAESILNSRVYRGLFTSIELSFSASNLRDGDVLVSKSDPVAVIYTKGTDNALQELGRTEVLLNSLNPQWITKHNITYHFQVVQSLLFRVYDVDTQFLDQEVKMLKLDEQHFVGEATCVLSQIVTKSNKSFTLDLLQKDESTGSYCPQNFGQITVRAEECLSSKTTTELIMRCSNLECQDIFSTIDPFLVISKTVESGTPIAICKTEVLTNDLSPTWKPVFLNIQHVGSKESPLTIECLNFNSNGKHDLAGKVQRSLAELEKIHSIGEGEHLFLPVIVGSDNHKKVLKSQLFVDKYSESVQKTFLDYLAGGCELNFMVAIDFTASNGNPHLPDSLHYIDRTGRPNAYQKAILEVGEVLQFYHMDKRFPSWGFGARPIDGPVSHCFNLNGSTNYCEVEGIGGIMTAYTSALFNVSLAGPTLFGPVISTAAMVASQSLANNQQKYFVLLIITDGVITDLQETRDALVTASDLPLSILIVGVGGADFKEMEYIDADKLGERLESSSGRVATRDIVQFVRFRDVQSGEVPVIQSLLAELPTQFLTYKGINPTTQIL